MLKPIPQKEKIRLNKLRRKRGQGIRTPAPVEQPRLIELRYYKAMKNHLHVMYDEVIQEIGRILESFESEYTSDSAFMSALSSAFDRLNAKYSALTDTFSKNAATSFVGLSNQANKRKFYKSLERSVGIDLERVIQNENIEDELLRATRSNVSLIKSLPSEYFNKLETMVYEGITQGNSAKSLVDQIKDLGGTTDSRAKLIARDQGNKLNGSLNKARQENLGVEEYIWRTSDDERVRDSHSSKNGKIFKWANPPSDTGHPGHDINCRCTAQAIIKVGESL